MISDAGLRSIPGVSARSVGGRRDGWAFSNSARVSPDRPSSSSMRLRLYTAKQILDSLGLEAAAWFLGADSVTSVVKALGYDWKQVGQQHLTVFMEGQSG